MHWQVSRFHALGRRRPSIVVALVVSTVLALVTPAAAINDESDGGIHWAEPPGTLRYWFDTGALPPQAMQDDVVWAYDQWDDFDDGFPLAIAPGTSTNRTVVIRWENMGTGIASVAIGGNPQHCGTGNSCTMRYNSQRTWDYGGGAPASNAMDARGVTLHEVGHSLGLGHSTASTRYNGVNLGSAQNREIIVMHPALNPGDDANDLISKDDCAAMQFQTRGDAVCNRAISHTWGSMPRFGTDSTSTTPRYFHGWGFNSGWQYVSANSELSGVTPNSAHWRMRPYPGTPDGQFGGIYDLEGAGSAAGYYQPVEVGSRWRVRAVVGAPDYNTTNAQLKICLYMRDDASASNTSNWKASQACTPVINLSAGQDWTTVTTGCYLLPSNATDERYLRSYVVVYDEGGGTVFISQWEIEQRSLSQCS